ncbi:MAG: glucose-1-phosphate cytidylyltransferase [Acidobacteria bacterium]|nr:glucose-1-phosphate cytidylyltransferase [Acidobacteriota bacterium]
MKAAILAGGLGTRLQEETSVRPKPMVEIGGWPLLWHVMKTYSCYGVNEFIIALGYKGDVIKDYFLSYRYRVSNLVVRLATGEVTVSDGGSENWTVHLLDTGLATQTGGRVRRVLEYAEGETVLLTYGDGVADVDVSALLEFHRRQNCLATVTAVRPPARFGGLTIDGDRAVAFDEKPQIGEGWINGGFFVLEPGVVNHIAGDDTVFEREPLERLASEHQLAAYCHRGFWQCMDTLRDVRLLQNLWESGAAPWKVWS